MELKIVILLKKALPGLKKANFICKILDVKKSEEVKIDDEWMNNIPKPYTWENLINKSGMTWRKLPDSEKNMS